MEVDQSLWFNDDDKYEMSIILLNGSILSESEESYIETLISKEITYGSDQDSSLVTPTDHSWFRNARAQAIQWILRTKDYFGFGLSTAYLSIAYFDGFLTRRSIDPVERSWAVRLLSVACLSLAAKMEERVVPTLPEYETGECRFSSDSVRRMELLILSTLEWRMSFVTPFAYLNWFSSKLRIGNSWEEKKVFSKSVGYIFSVVEDINLGDHRPSTIAAAAILAASDQNLTKHSLDSKLSILSSCGALENEHVLACYALMIRESRAESDDFVCYESSMNSSSNRGNKRRRLQL